MCSQRQDWEQPRTLVHIHNERQIGEQISEEDRYYLSSLPADTPQLAAGVPDASRSHWGIGNLLDVAFREDHSRARAGHAAQNFAVLRQFALNLLHKEQSSRLSIRAKRLRAGWDDRYLLKLLTV